MCAHLAPPGFILFFLIINFGRPPAHAIGFCEGVSDRDLPPCQCKVENMIVRPTPTLIMINARSICAKVATNATDRHHVIITPANIFDKLPNYSEVRGEGELIHPSSRAAPPKRASLGRRAVLLRHKAGRAIRIKNGRTWILAGYQNED
nr:PREDICTED: uncharacterized protein LOC107397952 [Tribolium castaneum]|eukprot:XP_015835629.1 PREDICTED: uncharacterized protein LOC107397952 [Tribolium castaneum]